MKTKVLIIALLLSRIISSSAAEEERYFLKNAFEIAIEKGDIYKVEEALKAEVDKDGSVECGSLGGYGRTPLMVACYCNRPAIVQLLLHSQANVCAQSRDNETALFLAAAKSRMPDITELLLKNGASAVIDVQTKMTGRSALMVAADRGDNKTVRVLLNWDANVDLVDKKGKSALIIAIEKFNYLDIKQVKTECDQQEEREIREIIKLLAAAQEKQKSNF